MQKNSLLTAISEGDSFTQNGAITNSSTDSYVLDLFFRIGGMRSAAESDIMTLFKLALAENPLYAMKIMFWCRDIRGGAGERRIFRIMAQFLLKTIKNSKYLLSTLEYVPEYGRFDDLLFIYEHAKAQNVKDKIISILYKSLVEDKNALCAKWIPRKGKLSNSIRKDLYHYKSDSYIFGRVIFSTPKEFRKYLVGLSNTVEQEMCSNSWTGINYNAIPSMASKKYRKAYLRHDKEGYSAWIEKLTNGDKTVKVNAGAIYPYDIVQPILCKKTTSSEQKLFDAQWKALPNYLSNSEMNILPLVDVSGSMTSLVGKNSSVRALDVAISLGLYIAERNTTQFKDAFISFSERPELVLIKGDTLAHKIKNISESSWGYNTDLMAVFTLILHKAKDFNIPASDMPTHLLILSDMEFDSAVGNKNTETIFRTIENMYRKSGYTRPEIIFWNLASKSAGNFPVKMHESGTSLISGFSPSILKSLLIGSLTPYSVMLSTIGATRYDNIRI